ncbi:MAG: tetratricopeptide repeat protein [Candidatus Delongbacteria bacterium]
MDILFLLAALLIGLLIAYRWVRRKESGEGGDPFVDGLEAMVRRDWREAGRCFKRAVEQDSENIRAYEQLGRVFRELGELPKAVKIHSDLTVREGLSGVDRSRIHLELAKDLRKMGRLREAQEAAAKAVEADRRNVAALVVQLELHEQERRWDDALSVLKRIESVSGREQNNRRSQILVEQGRQKMADGQGRPGRILVKEALKLNPKSAAGYILMGDSYLTESRIDEAIQYWEKLPFEVPERASLVFERLEAVYFDHGRFGEMEKFYTRVIQQRPDNPDAYLALAGFYERKGDFALAISILENGLAKIPGSLDLSRMLIRLLARSGQTQRLVTYTVELADRLLRKSRLYRCRSCGHESDEFHFRCPGCQGWETLERPKLN